MKYLCGILSLILSLPLLGQSDIAIGQWMSHLPYQQGISVAQDDEHIIYATPYSIFSIDKVDGSVEYLSKVDGLSDVGIHSIEYDQQSDQLFVIYTNSNIDVIRGSEIINVPNIKANTSISGQKGINDIFFDAAGEAYLATDFGVVTLDTENLNFGTTVITGIPMNQISQSGSWIYAASSEGVYRVNKAQVNNLADFEQWEYLGSKVGLPELYQSDWVTLHKDRIYIGAEDQIWISNTEQDQWTVHETLDNASLQYLMSEGGYLVSAIQYNDGRYEGRFEKDGEVLLAGQDCIGIPTDVVVDERGHVWYADLFSRVRLAEDVGQSCRLVTYDSPFSAAVSDIVIQDGQVLVASGGVAENFTYLFSRDGFYLYDQSSWTNYNELDNATLAPLELLSIYRVGWHPTQDKLYAGSYWAGLLELDRAADTYQVYDQENSTIRGSVGDPARERITGIAFDEEEHLWIATYGAEAPINVLTPEGQWISYTVPSSRQLTDILIDEYGYKWFPIDGGAGFLIFDDNGTITDQGDDRYRYVSMGNSELTTNKVLSMAQDIDGDIWVGTEEGPVIFNCRSDALEPACVGLRLRVSRDDILAFLLADQQINAIAIDGANRKWMGTRNGLFLLSADGQEQLQHFTTDNSPLFDNNVTALGYDDQSGLLWIGTDAGLMSYRTAATGGTRYFGDEEVYAYPNPVRPDYRGPIAIKGLTPNANVKITDVNGLLVQELTALGGQAIWDGKDQKGNDVVSGVYLVLSTEANAFDRPDAYVTKIMVVR